ncbi:unnamed protein product, partial [Notodromas monacha]
KLQEPHDLHVTADANEVYVAETKPHRLSKFVRGNLGKLQKSVKGTSASSSSSEAEEKPQVEELKPRTLKDSSSQSVANLTATRSKFSDGKRFSWGVEIMMVAAVPILVLGLILVLLRLRNR